MSEQTLEKSIKHSSRILEYNMDSPRLTTYNKKGIFNCSARFCRRPILINQRIVSLYTHSVEDEANRLFHKKCAIDLNIIVEK